LIRRERSHTKLIATLGPSTRDREVLKKLILEGIDVCRLNFSHGTREDHKRNIDMIHELNRELGTNVAVLADLQGPKIRVGEFVGGKVELKTGREFILCTDPCPGNVEQVHVSFSSLARDLKTGDIILIDDGRIELKVLGTTANQIMTEVVHGGTVSSRKGVNIPSAELSLSGLTDKDIEDTRFALNHGVDWIALSFVRSGNDVDSLRKLVNEAGSVARIVAKIEKPQALDDLDRIIELSDALMVARGDLGVEVEFHRVPVIQKMIVEKCISKATPVIIATQMMESMIHSFRPTRAEAADVANAVLEGADCLMLSGETAVGEYPDLVVRNMQRIIDWTEEYGSHYYRQIPETLKSGESLPDAICYSAVQMARRNGAKAIITYTHSGYTAVRISSHRPEADIFAFTMNRNLLPMLSLVWGVRAFYSKSSAHIEDYINSTMDYLKSRGLIESGDTVVHVGSIPLQEHGKTNMLKLTRI
jgi:pyruvate kinase